LGAAEKSIATLRDQVIRLRTEYSDVLKIKDSPADIVLGRARKTIEGICKCIYAHQGLEGDGKPARKLMLDELLSSIKRCGILPPDIEANLVYIQACGNLGVHDQGEHNQRIQKKDFAKPCLEALAAVANWYFEDYCHDIDSIPERPNQRPDRVDLRPHSEPTTPTPIPSEDAQITLKKLAKELGLSVARLIAIIRDALSIELRTPAAMLSPAQADKVRRRARSESGNDSSPERVQLQISPGVVIELCLIPAGTFAMGSPPSEEGHNDDEVVHKVTISESFYLASTPVTQKQFEAVVGHNPSYFVGPNLPVEMVSWFDCAAFCEALGDRLGRGLRLPTECEWEYACRAGSTTSYSLGVSITTAQANFDGWFVKPHLGESRKQTSPVSTFKSNAWGLFDMHGNVWEWCEDWYGDYPSGAVSDPRGPEDGEIRILRGGSWFHGPADARSAQRDALDPGRRHSIYGFRVAMSCR
jgi:formylglycine-generating enzyme required for sulfatase activity